MKKLNIFLLFCIFCVYGRSQAELLSNGIENVSENQGLWPKHAGLGPVVIQHPIENTTQDQTKYYDSKEECLADSKADVVCVFASSGDNAGKFYAEGTGLLPGHGKPNAGETYIFA